MIRSKLLHSLVISIIFLAVINFIAVSLHWYSLVWWFDMPMHFLGGLTVFYFCAIIWLPARKWVPNWRFLYEAVITTILIGVLWEALELYLHIRYGTPEFIILDSISDVFFDLTGALFAAYCILPLLYTGGVNGTPVGVVPGID